ncbi:hypothetical protein K491DRAFT_720200 [Lophiostoma macrostomum CBS 122681]|uniref:Uncharacterized protein n=1 Tax=Lophiostoma macrostomum CBS 122681 TaxID=1314788 RepID=A0A6A6STG8_9PLEO|nr:hypothetical protein K491DRAFT_720200 [Lophiostoma macrostomum CBS 122681]
MAATYGPPPGQSRFNDTFASGSSTVHNGHNIFNRIYNHAPILESDPERLQQDMVIRMIFSGAPVVYKQDPPRTVEGSSTPTNTTGQSAGNDRVGTAREGTTSRQWKDETPSRARSQGEQKVDIENPEIIHDNSSTPFWQFVTEVSEKAKELPEISVFLRQYAPDDLYSTAYDMVKHKWCQQDKWWWKWRHLPGHKPPPAPSSTVSRYSDPTKYEEVMGDELSELMNKEIPHRHLQAIPSMPGSTSQNSPPTAKEDIMYSTTSFASGEIVTPDQSRRRPIPTKRAKTEVPPKRPSLSKQKVPVSEPSIPVTSSNEAADNNCTPNLRVRRSARQQERPRSSSPTPHTTTSTRKPRLRSSSTGSTTKTATRRSRGKKSGLEKVAEQQPPTN